MLLLNGSHQQQNCIKLLYHINLTNQDIHTCITLPSYNGQVNHLKWNALHATALSDIANQVSVKWKRMCRTAAFSISKIHFVLISCLNTAVHIVQCESYDAKKTQEPKEASSKKNYSYAKTS